MLSITNALNEILTGNPLLQFGVSKRLFNLSRLSKELHPAIEVRTKKDVSESAILMALSRMQKSSPVAPDSAGTYIENLTIQTGISVFTFPKTKEVHKEVSDLFLIVQKSSGYITICEGMHEITVLLEGGHESSVRRCVKQKPKHHLGNLAAIGLSFDEDRYIATPGVIFLMLQQLFLQGINIIEVSSTYSGLTFYVTEEDAKIAFETFYRLLPSGKSPATRK